MTRSRALARPSPEPSGRGAPPTTYAAVVEMAEWMAAAGVGAEVAYATGPALDPREDAALLARNWAASGRALTFQRRGGDGVLRYWLRKLAPPAVATAATTQAPDKLLLLDPESVAGRVLRAVSRCANLGLPCPSDNALAEACALKDRNVAQYQLRKLRAAGLIRFEERSLGSGRNAARVVTVVATGKTTAANQESSERSGR